MGMGMSCHSPQTAETLAWLAATRARVAAAALARASSAACRGPAGWSSFSLLIY